MTNLEKLEEEAHNENVDIISNYSFSGNRIKGLYCDGTVALNKELSHTDKACTLAEELGHYHTTVGDIVCQSNVSDRKQELRARAWAYEKMIGLFGIIRAYKGGAHTIHEMAEYLEVTEDFLLEALAYYKNKYGVGTRFSNYVITFEPSICVLELI